MLWEDFEYIVGKDVALFITKHCPYSQGITISMKDGKIDVPLSDIRNMMLWYLSKGKCRIVDWD